MTEKYPYKSVRGHTCEGLATFQAAGDGCAPHITNDGTVMGCDDWNRVVILVCPFCGEHLAEADAENWDEVTQGWLDVRPARPDSDYTLAALSKAGSAVYINTIGRIIPPSA